MPTHVALLRGINVGGNKKVSMADLRELVSSLGHADVRTYIQSGNVLFTTDRADTAALAAELERAIAAALGVQAGVIVLTRDELATAARENPYPNEENPRYVHVVFLPGPADRELAAGVAAAEQQAGRKGGRDTARVIGRVVYVHTPDGYGTSELVKLLGRAGGPMSARAGGTARNMATVTELLARCDG